jgi:ATP-dependent RNA helicase DDX18/HAS1
VHQLDLVSVAKSFGFDTPPRVNLNFKMSGKEVRDGARKAGAKKGAGAKGAQYAQSGHSFSADNPYGSKKKGDKRQFQH